MKTSASQDNFYPQIVKLVVPIVIQNLLSAAVNSADVVMLNEVGQSSISAVSLAANYAGVLFMIYYGLGTGASMLSAQYWGKKDIQAIRVIEGIALRFSLIVSLCFFRFCPFCPQPDDEAFYQRCRTDCHWRRISACDVRYIPLLGRGGNLPVNPSQHWQSNRVHGLKCDDL